MNLNKKVNLYINDFLNKKINIKRLTEKINNLEKHNNTENFDYLTSLLYPEKSKGCRIPTEHPVQSCTFQLKGVFTFPNAMHGAFLVRINPYFLCSKACYPDKMRVDWNYPSDKNRIYCSTFNIYDLSTIQYADAMLDGHGGTITPANDKWIPLSAVSTKYLASSKQLTVGEGFQTIPTDVYNQYRLVSGSVELRYTGSLDKASGTLGGSILLENDPGLCCVGAFQSKTNAKPVYDPTIVPTKDYIGPTINTDFYDFNYFRHSLYHSEHSVVEGLRMLYFPPNNSYNEFVRVFNGQPYTPKTYRYGNEQQIRHWLSSNNTDYYKDGFWWYLYGIGLCQDRDFSAYHLSYCFNFECLPNAEFLDYCPTDCSPYTLTPEEKAQIYSEVQKVAIQKIRK